MMEGTVTIAGPTTGVYVVFRKAYSVVIIGISVNEIIKMIDVSELNVFDEQKKTVW